MDVGDTKHYEASHHVPFVLLLAENGFGFQVNKS